MKTIFDTKKSILTPISSELIRSSSSELLIKRDDLIDDLVSGNKWRKLKFNIEKALHGKANGLLTFGGAHSNHLIATAKACSLLNLKSIGIVRGDELNSNSNPTLKKCAAFGMDLKFVSREEYLMRNEKFYIDDLHLTYPNYTIVKEGGANYYGVVGCQEICKELPEDVTDIIVSAGTGTTAAGLLLGSKQNQTVHIVSALKGDWMIDEVRKLIKYTVFDDEVTEEILSRANFVNTASRKGYAKMDDELIQYITQFYKEHNVKLDGVYTAKSMFWLMEQLEKGILFNSSKIAFIHTGGIQGMQYLLEKKGVDPFTS